MILYFLWLLCVNYNGEAVYLDLEKWYLSWSPDQKYLVMQPFTIEILEQLQI